MRFDQLLFDHGRWHYELIEALGCYRKLCEFCSDESALRAHLSDKGRPWHVTEQGQVAGIDDEGLEQFIAPIAESIESAISAYRRQLTVVIVSITEAATTEAFEVLFAFRPETMKGLEKEGSQTFRAVTSLDELMSATQLDSLRMSLVERAVAWATQGRSKQTVLRRMERLFGALINPAVIEQYLLLVSLRNEIVHDNTHRVLNDSEVEASFDVGISFVEELGRLIANRNLPIHDPMHTFAG